MEAPSTKPVRRVRGILAVGAIIMLTLAMGIVAAVAAAWIYFHPKYEWTRGVVYGERNGTELTLDVVSPAKPNGVGVVFVVSGGWKSGTGSFRPWLAAPLLRHGYTVFPVYHLSQPDASVSEIFEDVSRGVRFVRAHAKDYGIDPNRLGVTGGSAGGHLSLMLATRGEPGPADAEDAVARESSGVQSVAIFYPVTDLTDLTGSTEYAGEGQPPKSFLKAFRQEPLDLPRWQETSQALSPILHLSERLPPTLIHHGNADTLVPFSQSKRFIEKAEQLGCTVHLKEVPDAGHGWLTMPLDIMAFADWFDRTL
jgi:acetyl esterase/lipase